MLKRALAALLALVLLAPPLGLAQESPAEDPSDLLNALLSGLLGFRDMSDVELQQEIADIGGVAFRSRVVLEYMSRQDLSQYLKEAFDSEYPKEQALADERTLLAFDLLPAGTDLRALRARLLEENIAGFYDERPGKKRLYAVSRERTLTPANQIILAHELRHALQDQYADMHNLLPDSVGDFDDRRVAVLCLFEGDATLVMERFLTKRLPGGGDAQSLDLSALALPEAALPGVPDVVRDQLVLPYVSGREFAQALWKNGGWDAVKGAWSRPPQSSEQVLHPEKYLASEAPVDVGVGYEPPAARLVSEGVLGELLIRTLLAGDRRAAEGWGGDRFRTWDLAGKTLLVWRTRWDTPADAREFLDAVRGRFGSTHGPGRAENDWTLYKRNAWSLGVTARDGAVVLVSSDDPAALRTALRGIR